MIPLHPATPAFVLCRQLHPGESLASFTQWHCTENVVPRLSLLFRLLQQCGGVAVRSFHELAQSPVCVRALEMVTRQRPGSLEHLQRKVLRAAVEDGYEERLVEGAYEWPQYARSRRVQAVCPMCLREAGYAYACWEFVQAPVCLRHEVRLVDHCHECGSLIKVDRPMLLNCQNCGALLEQAQAEPVDELQLKAARRVQTPRMQSFGTARETIPIEPQDLSGLLRLVLRPRPGDTATWGLTHDLEAIAIERRMDALGRMGQAFDGPRLDSMRLRAVAMGRWPYAALLPEGEIPRLLSEACRAVALPPDVTGMLSWDRASEPMPAAAELFKPDQPPRILELKRLAERLGLALADLRVLMGEESVLTTKPAGYGFDMDEVLRLEHALAAMLTLEQADRVLGWQGLAAEMVSMRLVMSVPVAARGLLLHARSVTRLFGNAHERLVTPTTKASTPVPLGEAAAVLSFDARQVAWSLRQLIGGSLPAYGWEAPFHLTSLLVDPKELKALAEPVRVQC